VQEAPFRTTVCDVADWAQVQKASAEIAQNWSQVDALICAAGIQGAVAPAMQTDPEAWSETVRVNLDGTFFSIRAFWDLLGAGQRRAKIVCFSGGGATKARPNFSAYAAAKTGIVRLVENLSVEWAGLPVDINAIAPGAINTAMTQETVHLGPELAGEAEYAAARQQLASGGQSIEKAQGLVEFLLSEKSHGVSGRLLAAQWDDWATLGTHVATLAPSEVYQLRRILPEERGIKL
jgi:NAD(P)-dependent dehydrogenase (short-subunit alcohol dehydrogenase family)